MPAAPGEDGHELGVDEGGQGDTGVGQAAPAGPTAHSLLSGLQEYSTVTRSSTDSDNKINIELRMVLLILLLLMRCIFYAVLMVPIVPYE